MSKTISKIVEGRLCLGCGACSYACPSNSISLINIPTEGIRPVVDAHDACNNCRACLDVCPAVETDLRHGAKRSGIIQEVYESYGPVLEIWEGHAVDSEIRFEGSSGGALSALSLYCIEREGMSGVLHIGQDSDSPLENKTRLSTTRAELLGCTGSRYAPASACDSLSLIEQAPNPCVFVGQPSEITAYRKAERSNPKLHQKTGLVLSFFCAGTPSRRGTEDLLKRFDIDNNQVEAIRYRGKGWPGFFSTRRRGEASETNHLSYRETWQFLRDYRPLSTFLFPDSSGEDADISCGDPWYHKSKTSDTGSSLIVVRTERGREIMEKAIAAGYLRVEKREPRHLIESQGSLAKKRGEVWGRILACRLLFLRTPKYKGFSLFQNWWRLPRKQRLRCILSTFKRAIKHKYHRPLRVSEDPAARSQ